MAEHTLPVINSSQDGVFYNDSYIYNGTAVNASLMPYPDTYPYIYILVTLMDVLVFIVGFFGNVLVLIVIFRHADMMTATNLFLANLSVADLLVLVVCIPSALLEMNMRDVWILGDHMCKLIAFLENMMSHVSILTILCISFERYYAICSPLERLSNCSKRRAGRILAGIWLFGAASTLPFVPMSRVRETGYYDGSRVLICATSIDHMWKQIYVVSVSFTLFLVLPMFLLVILYSKIGRQLVREVQAGGGRRAATAITQGNTGSLSRRQAVYMLGAIVVFFFVCNIPIRVFILWSIYSPSEQKRQLGHEGYLHIISFARIMFYLNSAGNPVLYNLISTKFREAFRRSVLCRPSVDSSRDASRARLSHARLSNTLLTSQTSSSAPRFSLLTDIALADLRALKHAPPTTVLTTARPEPMSVFDINVNGESGYREISYHFGK